MAKGPLTDPMMQEVLGRHMGDAWSLLLDRTAYEDFANTWPSRPQANPFAEVLSRVQKFVASETLSESRRHYALRLI